MSGLNGCEGGCGCELTADGLETVDGLTTVLVHDVERCRLIRTLREAGQVAVGDGSAVVRAWIDAFVVHVRRVSTVPAYTLEVQCVVSAETARAHSPDRLGVLGAWVEENLRRALDNPYAVTRGGTLGSVIARDPYTGRAGSS